MSSSGRARAVVLGLFALYALPALAQQTGAIHGRVTASDGALLPGVTVEARSSVLPVPRVVVSDGKGEYRLPALPPGSYTLDFALPGLQSVTRRAQVQLAQDIELDATLGVGAMEESVVVTATASLIDKESATVASSLSNEQIFALPIAQEYRDLQKLIPGVQYTQDAIRGPSAGGSGQDNVYQFDGVNVTLPLFGTLSAEPASHDIDQVTVVKGGARAVGFNRAAGFAIDSVSKSGTSEFHGQAAFQFQTKGMSSELTSGVLSRFEQDRNWLNLNLGGPVVKDLLHFYGSYYRPDSDRENRANLYGELPPFESRRNEGFGKLTFTPTRSLLFNFSYRHSKRTETSDLFLSNEAATTGSGEEARLRIAIAEGSWVIGPRSHATFKYTHFANETQGRPDNVSSAQISSAPGTRLDIGSLDSQGFLVVPSPVAGQAAYNAFIQPIIERYGYVQDGVRVGGGRAGFASQFNNQDFFRDEFQVGYNVTLGGGVTHDLHVGYQYWQDSEELVRRSNGWGEISVPGGRLAAIPGTGQSAFYTARFQRQTTGQAAPIISEYQSHNIELNDTMRWSRFTLNAGVLLSRDTLYGQGLREDPSTLSGYVAAPGNRYEMYVVPFDRAIQPRLGATWAYNDRDTLYASYAKYNPAASSLPRAASWDRNLVGTFVDAHFDQSGALFAAVPVGSSSGKLFVPDLTPRTTHEFLVGTARQLGDSWSARLYGRHRRGSHFWEDTNNNARLAFNPPAGIPSELYIPDLAERVAQIGSGSSYVIAELDGAYTRYWEVTLEAEWRDQQTFVRGTYTWSRYYGNFDQDNSTVTNDDNIFIGSSFIADGAGRQLWDFKDGTLRGDRPHLLKLYGTRTLPWKASAGAFLVAQSGQPWEEWSVEPYRALTTSTSETNRYAEKAGTRRAQAHWQLDLNYTQNFRLGERLNLQIAADLFNVFDKQTGYNFEPRRSNSAFGTARNFYDPRRLQLAGRLQF